MAEISFSRAPRRDGKKYDQKYERSMIQNCYVFYCIGEFKQ